MTLPQWFDGVVTDIVDGDTLKATLFLGLGSEAKDRDCGFHVYIESRRLVMHADLRLYGCNAAEHNTPGGAAAKANLIALLPLGSKIRIGTYGPDKYGGRYDASITLPDGTDLVTQLVAEQWAAAWDGTGTKVVPPWPRTVA